MPDTPQATAVDAAVAADAAQVANLAAANAVEQANVAAAAAQANAAEQTARIAEKTSGELAEQEERNRQWRESLTNSLSQNQAETAATKAELAQFREETKTAFSGLLTGIKELLTLPASQSTTVEPEKVPSADAGAQKVPETPKRTKTFRRI